MFLLSYIYGDARGFEFGVLMGENFTWKKDMDRIANILSIFTKKIKTL